MGKIIATSILSYRQDKSADFPHRANPVSTASRNEIRYRHCSGLDAGLRNPLVKGCVGRVFSLLLSLSFRRVAISGGVFSQPLTKEISPVENSPVAGSRPPHAHSLAALPGPGARPASRCRCGRVVRAVDVPTASNQQLDQSHVISNSHCDHRERLSSFVPSLSFPGPFSLAPNQHSLD